MPTPAPCSSWSDAAVDLQFIGREAELSTVCGWVVDPAVEVVELLGEPGVGKSRLARQVLHVVGPSADTALIDDAHLLDPDERARRVAAARAPGRTVLVTDRRGGTGASVTHIVCPLPAPDDYSLLDLDAAAGVASIALLVAFRRTVQPSFVLDSTTLPAAAELCAHFRGVPRDLQVASTLLTTVDSDLASSPEATRSPTVTALLSQSRTQHGLDDTADVAAALSSDARSVLAGAALGVDGVGRQALARITGLEVPRLTAALTELTDRAVLVASEQPSAGPGGLVHARFHVPATALSVAAAVAAPDLVGTFADRCTEHHLDVVTRAVAALDGRQQVTGFAMLHAEAANVVAALDRARDRDPAGVLDAVLGLRTYWRALGLVFDVQEQVEALTEYEHRLGTADAARLSLALADAEARLGEPELAAQSLQRARVLAGDTEQAEVLVTEGVLALTSTDASDGSALLAGAAALRAQGRAAEADRAVLTVALHCLFDGRPQHGADLCTAILPDARRRGDHLTSGGALLRLSACHAAMDDPVGADEYWSRASVHLRQLGFAVTLGQIAEVVGSCVQSSSAARGRRVTELLGAMVDERRSVSDARDEPTFVVAGFERRMLQVLGPVEFAAAWTRGRATTPAALLAAVACDAVARDAVARDAVAVGEGPTVTDGAGVTTAVTAVATHDRFASWSDLTPRETEVALLVADGLSNRQAARRLAISEWTVVNHMRGVLGKLGLRSRVQLARWVAEREAHAGTAAGAGGAPGPATDLA